MVGTVIPGAGPLQDLTLNAHGVAAVPPGCFVVAQKRILMHLQQVEERKHLPTLREFLNPVVEDMDPENCIEEEYRVCSQKHTRKWIF